MTTGTTTNQSGSATDKARETASTMKDDAKQTASRMADQTRDAWGQAKENPTPSGIQGAIESLPSTFYLYGTLGSIGLSLLLRLFGRREFANFIGLWAPTILALGMLNKQMRPSRDM